MKTTIKFPENIIINRVHASKVAILITIIVISAMMILTTSIAEFDNNSIIPPIVTIATIAGIISSAIIAMSLKRKVYAPSESPTNCIVLDFADSRCDEIAKAASDNRWSSIPQLTQESNGTAMRLEVVYSEDLKFAAYQFFSYVPHSYESCSQIFYVDKDDVKRINFAELKS
ncbi:MAG: hypothetical protein SNG81_06660 [Rikenellaceae bacterium]